MARTRTSTEQRQAYNDRLVAAVSDAVGRKVTVRQAMAYRKWENGIADRPEWLNGNDPTPPLDLPETRGNPRGGRVAHMIPDRDISDLNPDDLKPIGTLLAQVEDFKVLKGGTASLSLTTSVEFRHLMVDAAVVSQAHLLVAVLYEIPKEAVMGDNDDD